MMLERSHLSRILPFAAYMLFLAIEDFLGKMVGLNKDDLRWVYPAKIALVTSLLWYFRKDYKELAQRLSPVLLAIAVALGILVFVLWINATFKWMVWGSSNGFDPRGAQGGLDWFFVIVRISGAALIVPIMEELFFRSYLMRWMSNPNFTEVAPEKISFNYLLIISVLFAVEHTLWFAGLLAGLIYGFLYMKSKNLWASIIAHGVTNGVLGIWVLQTARWEFW